MRTIRMTLALLIATIATAGCATHYDMAAAPSMARSGLINDPKQVSRLEKAITDQTIAQQLDVDVRAKLPTSLAVAKVDSAYWSSLAPIDAEELNAWQEVVEGQALLRGVHPVTSLAMQRAPDGREYLTLSGLRAYAASMRCELLLVYFRSDASVNNYNDAAALYWTLVGLWCVPGNVLEQRTVMQAILVDCRTGTILGTATGDSRLQRTIPAAYTQVAEDELRAEAPKKAFADLRKGCRKMLASVVARACEKAER